MVSFINGRWSGTPVVGEEITVQVIEKNHNKPFVMRHDGRNVWDQINEVEVFIAPPAEPEPVDADPTPES